MRHADYIGLMVVVAMACWLMHMKIQKTFKEKRENGPWYKP